MSVESHLFVEISPEQKMRFMALDMAQSLSTSGVMSPEYILGYAKEFEAFLIDGTVSFVDEPSTGGDGANVTKLSRRR